MGNEDIEVSVPGEILSNGEFYDYDKKYGKNSIKTQVPANISQEKILEGQNIAKKIYLLAGCKGMARIDFFLDEKKRFIFNEINPIPGFTKISLYPKMWEASGIKGENLVDRLIIAAINRKKRCKYFL